MDSLRIAGELAGGNIVLQGPRRPDQRLRPGARLVVKKAASGPIAARGSALIATGIVSRTTKDFDIVALMDASDRLIEPSPLPETLLTAAKEIAPFLGVGSNWLNNGPSRGEGGLFQMGLPDGFASRLTKQVVGSHLTVYWIGRLDQIFFKVYAAVDRGGRDIVDIYALNPTEVELELAARWAMQNDVSPEYKWLLGGLFKDLGYETLAQRL